MPHKLEITQRGALGNTMSSGHAALHQYSSRREKQWGLCCIQSKGSKRKCSLLCQLPFHPSLGTWAKWMRWKDFICAAASLLLMRKTFGVVCTPVVTVAGEEVIGWQTCSHRSGEILALCAVPNKKEQGLSPCCMYTKPACCLQVGHSGLQGNSGICFLP